MTFADKGKNSRTQGVPTNGGSYLSDVPQNEMFKRVNNICQLANQRLQSAADQCAVAWLAGTATRSADL